MNESKHTPGPWMAASRPSSIVGWPVVAPGDGGRSVCNITTGHDQSEANAHLISAAPDLLAALKAVIAIADRATVEFDRARAAIAKAEGRA